eukprot:7793616-Alexandrium_andersonii.AAC.1
MLPRKKAEQKAAGSMANRASPRGEGAEADWRGAPVDTELAPKEDAGFMQRQQRFFERVILPTKSDLPVAWALQL